MNLITCLIKQITWEWIGEFEKETILKFDEHKKISLVQITNGYGKTTTLVLLQHLFTNKQFDERFLVEQIQPKGPQSKEGNNKSESEGRFEVLVEIDGKDWRLGITFDHIENKAQYYTVKPSGSGAGRTNGWNPPLNFKRVFEGKHEIIRLFFLDAEISKEINKEIGRKTVTQSITDLSNLAPLITMTRDGGDIEKYHQKILKK